MDAKTNSQSTRDRAATADTSGPSGELIPILMRIPDVRPPARGKAKRDSAAKELAAKEAVATLPPSAAALPPTSDTYEPSFKIADSGDVQRDKTVHLEASSREFDVPTSKETASQEVAERVVDSAVAAGNENSPVAEGASELPPPKESAEQPATNRRQRQRRPASGPKPSWWKTQGRTIAAVFVIGLGLTIYLARTQRSNKPDTAREDEVTEIDISSSAVTDDALDVVRPSHSPHVASKPKPSVPPLAEHDLHDDMPVDDVGDDLDTAEDADSSLASAEADSDTEEVASSTDASSTDIDWGELPEYPRTPEDKYPADGPLPRTAKTPNSSSTR